MKRSGMAHSKLKKLQRVLQCREPLAVGILECLWHLAARETPRGDIGKLSNEDIALAIDWEDGDALVAALVQCGWVDEHPVYRLVIHDWHDHCDEAVKKLIQRNGLTWASARLTAELVETEPDKSGQEATTAEVSSNVATCLDISSLPKPKPMPKPPEDIPSECAEAPAAAEPARVTGKKAQQAVTIAVDRAVKHYRAEYARRFPGRDPPLVTGQHRGKVRALVEELLSGLDGDWKAAEAETLRVIGLFVADEHPRVLEAGHDLTALSWRFNGLRAEGARRDDDTGNRPGGYPEARGGGAGRGAGANGQARGVRDGPRARGPQNRVPDPDNVAAATERARKFLETGRQHP